MRDPDDVSYFEFTGRQQRDKALSVLSGILQGFISDREFHPKEVVELKDWQAERRHLMGPQDFREIDKSITRALMDGRLEQWEVDEIRALCQRAASNAPYFDAVTKALQELFGYLHGILADRVIKSEELKGLISWMEDYSHLKKIYPFTEIEALVFGVLRDKTIDPKEQKLLQAFFSQFVVLSRNQSDFTDDLKLSAKELCVGGICAVAPDVTFEKKLFCFTGFSTKGKRSDFAREVTQRGGTYHDSVIQDLNYLVIGGAGNPSWAYSCYGRKVEAAILMRKRGNPLLIIDEVDFWDAAVQ
ncbi:MAG TPA: BRCT domain-containing protein [Lacunisphaera sp.]|nr:BRCT domain-containing protein [Lacunisphaera sp.]